MLIHDPGFEHPRKEIRRPAPAYHVAAAPEEMVEANPRELVQPGDQFRSSDAEMPWDMLDDEEEMTRIEEAAASVRAGREDRE